jgi:hypothetical protein
MERTNQLGVEELGARHFSQTPYYLNTVMAFSSRRDMALVYGDFVTQLLGLVILMVKQYPRSYAEMYEQLLHKVTFPLLAITEEEHQLFADDPEEFNNLAEDCADRQSFGVLKSEAARLLETICDEYAQVDKYVVQHAIISLKVRFSLDPNFLPDAQHFLTV